MLLAILAILALTVGVPAVVRKWHAATPLALSALPGDELPLGVRHEGRALRLSWNPDAPVLRNAANADLYISDGRHVSQLKLDRGNLASGSAVYWPETDKEDIAFRLELTLSDRRVKGSIVTSTASPEPARVEQAASTLAPVADSTRQGGGLSHGGERQLAEQKVRQPVETPAHETAAEPSPFVAPPPAHAGMETADRSTPSRKSLLATERPPEPTIMVRAEPLPPSPLTQGSGKVTQGSGKGRASRRSKKKNRGAVVATPSREARPPELPGQRTLASPVSVDVRVDVNEMGKVTYAKADPLQGRQEFADAAVEAAMRWQFTPARVGNEDVPAKVILHFRFDPTNH